MVRKKQSKLPVISLENLNCRHCKRILTDCKSGVNYMFTPGDSPPEKFYCVDIWKNYSEEVVK
jgi:hypothetical protein